MTDLVVSVRGLGRTLGTRAVLEGVDLEMRAGEVLAVVGRSGAGKTTLLRVLAGIDRGAIGDVRVTPRRAIGFQDPRLLPWLTVLDNVTLGLPRQSVTAARVALAEVGLSGHERAWPKTLSGGEAQRAALARAIVRRPRLLLLDEPFASLDAITRMQMHDLMRRLHAMHGPAMLLVTHDLDEAVSLADRVLVLANGRIAAEVVVSGCGSTIEARNRLMHALGLAKARRHARSSASSPAGGGASR